MKAKGVLTLVLGIVLLAELAVAVGRVLPNGGPAGEAGDLAALGRLLFTDYLYAFEITSLLILAALVGALALAGKKEGE
jgi:NADH-quinone oxidoreductase subunit J